MAVTPLNVPPSSRTTPCSAKHRANASASPASSAAKNAATGPGSAMDTVARPPNSSTVAAGAHQGDVDDSCPGLPVVTASTRQRHGEGFSCYPDPMLTFPSILKSPASQATYAKVISAVSKLGPFEVEEKKTSLHLTHGRAFAGVQPRAYGILLNLVFDAPLKNARVHKSEQVSANRHHVEFKLEDPADVDSQLVTWIEQAYTLTK